MYKNRHIRIFIVLLALISATGNSQTTFNSPFSLKGIGDLPRVGIPIYSAMGGITIGIRDKGNVNYINPASYSIRDSMLFVFNFGVQGKGASLSGQNTSTKTFDLNLNHLIFSFPVTRHLGFAFGLVPYSYTGYTIKEKVLKDDPLYNKDVGQLEYLFRGEGGVTRFVTGASLELLNHVSIGFNFDYLFGQINKSHTMNFLDTPGTFNTTMLERKAIVSDFDYDIGLQYSTTLRENNHLVIGMIAGNNKKINYSVEQLDYAIATSSDGKMYKDTIAYLKIFNQKFTLPFYIGLGFTFSNDKWLFGVDYKYQDWSKAELPYSHDKLTPTHSLCSGVQFIPNPRDFRRYWKIVRYRMGAHYENAYFEVNNTPVKDFGISFGVGFPIPLSRSVLNISWESGLRGSIEKNYVREQYNIINFGISINSFWFVKRKYK